MIRPLGRLLLALGLLLVTPDAAPADDHGLGRLRALYLAAVGDAAAIDEGLAEVERLRDRQPAGTLAAYRGALVTLRAKHALWPPTKLRHLREGLTILDRVIATHPDHAEARYLRLMSCYYLPGVLGRGDSVRADFAALARLLPAARARYPRDLFAAIVGFVLDNGELTSAQREVLQAALADE